MGGQERPEHSNVLWKGKKIKKKFIQSQFTVYGVTSSVHLSATRNNLQINILFLRYILKKEAYKTENKSKVQNS